MTGAGDAPDTMEEWMRQSVKDAALAARRANLSPRVAALELQQWGDALSSGLAGSSSAPVFWDGGTVIIFPVPYAAIPIVLTDVSAGGSVLWTSVSSISTTQVIVRLHRIGSAPGAGFVIHWTAHP